MADLASRVDTVMSKSLRLRFWRVEANLTGSIDKLNEHLDGHFQFVNKSLVDGRIFAAGPLLDEKGRNVGAGMIIMIGNSIDEIRTALLDDPFYSLGIRQYEIREWQVNVGRMTLRVDIGTASGSVVT